MLMHACEIAQGNFWQKMIAQEALKALGARGLLRRGPLERHRRQWLWKPGMAAVGANRERDDGQRSTA